MWVYWTFRIEGFHSYSGTEGYLANRHRHLFYFNVRARVKELDREIEFIEAQTKCVHYLSTMFVNQIERHGCDFDGSSCEDIANYLIKYLRHEFGERDYHVSVSEDNENGAIVEYNV